MPFRITKHNAAKLEKNTNTLVYRIRDQKYPEKIDITFDQNKLYNKRYFSDIFNYIKPELFFLIIGILIISIVIFIIYRKNNKKDKQYQINY